MIKLGKEGFYFVSKSGIKYVLYEGVTFGGARTYTSDTIFIFLSDERYLEKVNDHFVGYWMGATFFEEDLNEYNKNIGRLVERYELENSISKTMEERILETLDAYLITNRDVLDEEKIEDICEQIETVEKYIEEVKPCI